MNTDELSFVYSGKINNEVITACIHFLEDIMSKYENLQRTYRKLSFLMIENFQNVLKYGNVSEELDFEHKPASFFARSHRSGFYICSVNLIKNKLINEVKQYIDELNLLDRMGLNKRYKKVLTNDIFNDIGGAGLGFIEMLRRSKEKIVYDFVPLNKNYSYVYLLLKSREHIKDCDKTLAPVGIDWFKNLHEETHRNNAVFIYKGLFKSNIIEDVTNMVCENTKVDINHIHHIVFNLVLETLHNMHLNTLDQFCNKNYFFTLHNRDNKFVLSTHKHISPTRADNIQHLISKIKNMSYHKLNERSKELSIVYTTDANVILELILLEIAMDSMQRFDFICNLHNGKHSFDCQIRV